MKIKQMTAKRANKLIKQYTTEITETGNDSKIDKIERKICILENFINFQKELANTGW
jgi:hypothetical protein